MAEQNIYQTPDASLASEQDELEYQPKIFALSGRIGRLRYLAYYMLYFIVFYGVFLVLAGLVGALGGQDQGYTLLLALTSVSTIGLLVGSFALMRRRLNDVGVSGWVSVLSLVPIINFFFALYLMFAPGDKEANRYGSRPCQNHPALWVGAILPLVAIIGILAAVALPAYQDYVERANEMNLQLNDE